MCIFLVLITYIIINIMVITIIILWYRLQLLGGADSRHTCRVSALCWSDKKRKELKFQYQTSREEAAVHGRNFEQKPTKSHNALVSLRI